MSRGRGVVLVLSGPSGVGKTTLCKRLLRSLRGLTFSVSYTTRPRRPGERNGVEYHFVTPERFHQLRRAGRFLEWARVDGNLYGTSKDQVRRILQRGKDVLLDIDTKGATQVRRRDPHAVLIFVLPPGPGALIARHRRRRTDPVTLRRRLDLARQEVLKSRKYDYLVFNDRLDAALESLKGIVLAERCRSSRQSPRTRQVLRAFHG